MRAPTREDWIRAYDVQITDEAKVRFLLMLKEKRDRQSDTAAGNLLEELTAKWLKERFSA